MPRSSPIVANSKQVRVVLDTNVLISACWTPDGVEARTVQLARSGAFTPCASEAVWAEYREVLAREKFRAIRSRSVDLMAALQQRTFMVEPNVPVHAALDEDDNRFLECADAAGAQYLVTGNLKHYPAVWGATELCNARQFLDREFRSVA